jgi:hypothetical protein
MSSAALFTGEFGLKAAFGRFHSSFFSSRVKRVGSSPRSAEVGRKRVRSSLTLVSFVGLAERAIWPWVDKTLMGADFRGASAMGCRERRAQLQVEVQQNTKILNINFNFNI